MTRIGIEKLVAWKNKHNRMPLMINGARQVGKTWLMQEFGRTEYKNTLYINFDKDDKAKEIFASNLNPKRIMSELALKFDTNITPDETLIIFDEIQECDRALVSLKYFCEDAPEYHVVSAGSLLGVAIHQGDSFPVGKVDMLNLYPMNFAEFLDAVDEKRYHTIVEKHDWALFSVIENDLIRLLKHYYYIGGMPKAVLTYIETGDLNEVRRVQEDILTSFRADFSKHVNTPSIPKIGMLWESVPAQLAKEKKRFVFRDMKAGARSSQFEDALWWLEQVGLIYKVNRVPTAMLPLTAYQEREAFKLYMVDVGLLSAQAGLTIQNLAEPNAELFSHFKGALTEQYVLQELKTFKDGRFIFYWANDKGKAEVDFLMQHEGEIIPIEAKASVNLQAKSLKAYIDYYAPKMAVRTSLARYGRNKNLYDIPLYLIGQLQQICG
jgi:predicted AAA+ superfamily ATPase